MEAAVLIGGFLILFFAWFLEKYVLPRRMIRPPVNRILQRISSGDIFYVDTPTNKDREASNGLVDYVVTDTERGVKTYLYREMIQGSCIFSGDLDWMNKWEREEVFMLVRSICCDRRQKYEKACAVEKKARDDRRREEAKSFY